MVVQRNLEFLRDQLEGLQSRDVTGTATIIATGTQVTVNFAGDFANYVAVVTPTKDPGSRFWISNKTATSFRINLSSAAPAGGVDFDYLVKGDA